MAWRKSHIFALFAALALLAGLFVAPVLTLTFAPTALIFMLLAADRRPGERALLALRARRLSRRRPRGARRVARPRLPDVRRPAGHARSSVLGQRPPPALPA